jgi:hypothetical protein
VPDALNVGRRPGTEFFCPMNGFLLSRQNIARAPMFIRTRDSHPRSIAKALSWRIAGSLDTFVPSFIFTRSLQLAGSIALAEMFTKMALYYFHD